MPRPNSQRPYVVVVDADDDSRQIVTQVLTTLDCETIEADAENVAVKILAGRLPDLLIIGDTDWGVAIAKSVTESARLDAPIIFLSSAVADADRRLRSVEAGAADLLEKPIDERLLAARIKQLLSRQRRRGDEELLLNFIVHDMKQPIFAIASNAEWLILQEQPLEYDDALADIVKCAGALHGMVEDLLTVSRMEQSKLAIQRAPIRVQDFLDSVEKASRRVVGRLDLRFENNCPNDLLVSLDLGLLGRVAGNIIQNAIRYAKTSIRVRAGQIDSFLELRLGNDGPEIPPGQREHMFEKFAAVSQSGGGSVGLGLHFCKLVAEAHGGQIVLQPTTEWPVEFILTIPLH